MDLFCFFSFERWVLTLYIYMSFSRQIKVSNALMSFREKKDYGMPETNFDILTAGIRALEYLLMNTRGYVLICHFVKWGGGQLFSNSLDFQMSISFSKKPSLYSSKYLWKDGKGLICLNSINHFDEPKDVSRRLQVKAKVWVIHPSIYLVCWGNSCEGSAELLLLGDLLLKWKGCGF